MKVISNHDDFKFTVQLTRSECRAILTVSSRIGGPVKNDDDGHQFFNNMASAIRQAGVTEPLPVEESYSKGSIYFA